MFIHIKNFVITNYFLLIIIFTALLVYSSLLSYSHISWDDPEMIFKNVFVKDFNLTELFSNHFVGNYIPLTMLVHAISWFLFKTNDAGYHLINLIFHLINGIIIFQIGKKLFKDVLITNIVVLIFLLHPLQVESVAWISELKNILSSTFYLIAISCYLNYINNFKKLEYYKSFLFFVLACFFKSSVIILPLTLICLDLFHHQKFNFKYLINKIPFLVLSIIFGLINLKSQYADMFINHSHEFNYYERFSLAGYALMKYLSLFFLPYHLSVIYPYPIINIPTIIIGFVFIGIVISFIIFLLKKNKIKFFSILLFILVNLILVLQFIPFGEVLYADRYMYIPIIGFGWVLALLIVKIIPKPQFLVFLLLFSLSLLSFQRLSVWKNSMLLFDDILNKYPNQFIALNSAGVEKMNTNKDTEALNYFNKATLVAPNNYKGFYNRGLFYLKVNKPDSAIKSLNQSLQIYQYSKAFSARASAYYALSDLNRAITDANVAISKDNKNANAHFILANCYNDSNILNEAILQYNIAINLNKEEPDFYFKRAIAFGKKQDFNLCITNLLLCLSFNPNYYEAHYWMGVAKINLKQDPCEDLKIAAKFDYKPAFSALNKYCK